MKPGIVIYLNIYPSIQKLGFEDKGRLLDAIFQYSLNKKIEVELSPVADMAFGFIKEMLDKDTVKYDSICTRNQLNGLKGGRPRNPNNPVGILVTHNNPKKPITITTKLKENNIHTPPRVGDVTNFINQFNTLFTSSYKETPKRRLVYNQRLKNFTPDQILVALEHLATDDFSRGKNDRGWVADPDYLLRTDEMVDRWLNKTSKPKSKFSIIPT